MALFWLSQRIAFSVSKYEFVFVSLNRSFGVRAEAPAVPAPARRRGDARVHLPLPPGGHVVREGNNRPGIKRDPIISNV